MVEKQFLSFVVLTCIVGVVIEYRNGIFFKLNDQDVDNGSRIDCFPLGKSSLFS